MTLIRQGTRVMHTLTGNYDEDVFLTKDDMGEKHWELLMGCYHQGQCDEDTEEAAKYFQFKNDQGYVDAVNYLIDCGIESEKFLEDEEEDVSYGNIADDDLVMQYYLWMLSADIQERG